MIVPLAHLPVVQAAETVPAAPVAETTAAAVVAPTVTATSGVPTPVSGAAASAVAVVGFPTAGIVPRASGLILGSLCLL